MLVIIVIVVFRLWCLNVGVHIWFLYIAPNSSFMLVARAWQIFHYYNLNNAGEILRSLRGIIKCAEDTNVTMQAVNHITLHLPNSLPACMHSGSTGCLTKQSFHSKGTKWIWHVACCHPPVPFACQYTHLTVVVVVESRRHLLAGSDRKRTRWRMKENAKSRMNIKPVDNKLYFPAPCMLAHAPFHTARKFVPPTSHDGTRFRDQFTKRCSHIKRALLAISEFEQWLVN